MKKIAIFAKVHNPRCQGVAGELVDWLKKKRIKALVEPHLARHLGITATKTANILKEADLAVVLGGDGTLISTVRLIGERNLPILGVNLGSLGFLTEVTVEEMYAALERCLKGDFRVSNRVLLKSTLTRNGVDMGSRLVLNDVVINKGALARIIDLATMVDEFELTTFKADGLIISSPTGSTGYSLAAGGPILYPTMNCMIVTPICPHILTNRPIVLEGSSVITVTVTSLDDEDIYLTLDGQVGTELKSGDVVTVKRARHSAKLVVSEERDYFEILRKKLKWGER
ncbi:MAG: NAD(+)/NADH kinase [Desulfuromonadales bacterium]|nr:NAD(+)/NADH kinase [Desulfuromonadales bacterium]